MKNINRKTVVFERGDKHYLISFCIDDFGNITHEYYAESDKTKDVFCVGVEHAKVICVKSSKIFQRNNANPAQIVMPEE